jgi:copper chaperone
MKDVKIAIRGMSCGHCLNAVSKALASAPGVSVESVQIGRASIRYDENLTDLARVTAAVEQAGYAVEGVMP